MPGCQNRALLAHCLGLADIDRGRGTTTYVLVVYAGSDITKVARRAKVEDTPLDDIDDPFSMGPD